jgi:hypothetical protein
MVRHFLLLDERQEYRLPGDPGTGGFCTGSLQQRDDRAQTTKPRQNRGKHKARLQIQAAG